MLLKRAWWSLLFMVMPVFSGSLAIAEQAGVGETVPLSELIAGGEIIVEDKRFYSFEYNLAAGDLQPEDIAVQGIIQNVMQNGQSVPGYGLLFSGDFSAGGLSSPQVFEAGLSYRVEILEEFQDLYLISDVHLDGTTAVFGTGDARITENFIGINVPSLAIRELRVDDELLDFRSSDDILFSDFLDVPGFTEIAVLKDIRLEAGANAPIDVAEISTFSQLFTQIVIPEPTTVTLAMVCGIGALLNRRCSLLTINGSD